MAEMRLHSLWIEGQEFAYFYDRHQRLWTVYARDDEENQIGEAQYCTKKDEVQATADYLYASLL